MDTRLIGTLCIGLVFAGIGGPVAGAQVTSLPFDLVDVADDPLAPDFCGVTFLYKHLDPASEVEGGGASWADFDNDGLIDLYLPNSQGEPSKLYRNQGDGTFVDVAVERGIDDPSSASASGTFFDYDRDGDLDLLVLSHLSTYLSTLTLYGPVFKLWRNTGAAGGYTFKDVTDAAGFVLGPTAKLTEHGLVGGIAVGDYDRDGWPDFFVDWFTPVSTQDQWRLMHSAPNPLPCDGASPENSPRIFEDATVGSGLEGEFGGNPQTPRWWDVNRDGWPDLHIAMDYVMDVLFLNNGDGTFTDVATAVGLNGDPPENRNEMGSALGDTDNDLDLDLHLTNVFWKDRFYRNNSSCSTLAFNDVAPKTGLTNSAFGWGDIFADLDNDGDLDHACVTSPWHGLLKTWNPVHLNLFPQTLPGVVTGAWADVMDLLPDFSKVNILEGDAAMNLAAADYDNDGDLDLVVGRNQGQSAGLFRNTLVSNNRWLEVDLVETDGSLDVSGARLYLKDGALTQMRLVSIGGSTRSQEPLRQHFGLGPAPGSQHGPTVASSPPAGSAGSALGAGGLGGTVSASGAPASRQMAPPPPLPAFLVVRWRDGPCQILRHPPANEILRLTRSAVDDVGDLDADGHLTQADEQMLLLATADPAAFALAYPESPGLIVGDVNDDGLLDPTDIAAWALLPPH